MSCATALRSPLFGCGDDDLWTWMRDGGSFNLLAPMHGRGRRPNTAGWGVAVEGKSS